VKHLNAALNKLGLHITQGIGTMWAAIVFASLALVSLPGAIGSGDPVIIVAWTAQTFLQLVLLPIIMVGQRLQANKTEARDNETHAAVMASHAEIKNILRELQNN
jgi:hypothetical protein